MQFVCVCVCEGYFGTSIYLLCPSLIAGASLYVPSSQRTELRSLPGTVAHAPLVRPHVLLCSRAEQLCSRLTCCLRITRLVVRHARSCCISPCLAGHVVRMVMWHGTALATLIGLAGRNHRIGSRVEASGQAAMHDWSGQLGKDGRMPNGRPGRSCRAGRRWTGRMPRASWH